MHTRRFALAAGLAGILSALCASAQAPANAPLPDIRQLMQEVLQHQKQLEKVRESYTYSSAQTIQDVDSNGRVTKTETSENEDFFVNGHVIERTVKKNGQPLNEHEQQKETERVTKLVEKAEKTPSDQPLEGPSIRISRILEIMDNQYPTGDVSRAAGHRLRLRGPQGRKDTRPGGGRLKKAQRDDVGG